MRVIANINALIFLSGGLRPPLKKNQRWTTSLI
jgi:hypothetical protein